MTDMTNKIIKKLEDINRIPRGSGNMEGIHKFFYRLGGRIRV